MNRFLQSFLYAYQAEAGEEGKQGGGGEQPKTYTQAEFEAALAEHTAGLKNQNASLLDEKKKASQKAKDEEAERIRVQQENAKQSGKMEEFEKTIRSQYDPLLAERDGRISKMSERILGSERKSVIASLSGILIDESAADVIGMMVRTEFDGDEVVTKFVGADGSVITTDPAQFKKYLCDHKAFSHLIRADVATGGGANGNNNPNGGANRIDPTLTGIEKTRAEQKQRLQKKFNQKG